MINLDFARNENLYINNNEVIEIPLNAIKIRSEKNLNLKNENNSITNIINEEGLYNQNENESEIIINNIDNYIDNHPKKIYEKPKIPKTAFEMFVSLNENKMRQINIISIN